jgi:hypothetical protein
MKAMSRSLILSVVFSVVFFAAATTLLCSQTNVTTWHYDNWRDGLNSTETTLTQANVNATQFGKLCSAIVDGQIFGQPLVVSSGGLNTVYVGTQNDSVYAINGANCTPIASVSLLQTSEEATQCTDVGSTKCRTVAPIIGVLGTPVIDLTSNTIYLVSESELTTGVCNTTKKKPASCFIHRLHALDLTTLAEKFNGPVAIAGSFQGVTFASNMEIQRPGLLLLSGVMANGDSGVYIGFSEIDGYGTAGKNIPHGWVFGYDAQNLTNAPYIWSVTPNGEGGGVWASGAAMAAGYDSPGGSTYIYLSTGDGDFTANTGGSDYGDSFVKLTTSLIPSSYFTPFGQGCMNINDQDFGSSGVMLIPDSGSTYYAIASSKQGIVYGMNRANPGGYSPPTNSTCPATGANANLQTFQGSPHAYYTTPASWNSYLYYIPMSAALYRYSLDVVTPPKCLFTPICTGNSIKSSALFTYGTNLSISASGTTTGTAMVWAASGNGWPTVSTPAPALLHAFDAEHTVSKAIPELWNNTMCPTRDQTGNATKFVLPTIANGIVYLGGMDPTDTTNTRGELDVFGLTSATCN